MPKGGSRFGAGRPARKVKAEQIPSIDIRRLKREGLLKLGQAFTWTWSRAGEPIGSISAELIGDDAVILRHASWLQRVELTYTDCHLGGRRMWVVCPHCGGRCSVIYLRGQSFACRSCKKVAYSSQSEDYCGRIWRKQYKLEKRLGENWSRPKGMHHSTHERIFSKIFECEEKRDEALAMFAQRLFNIEIG